MVIVTIDQAKRNLWGLIKRALAGEKILIARRNTPVIRLIPVGEIKKKRKPGALKGRLKVGAEFFQELSEQELAD